MLLTKLSAALEQEQKKRSCEKSFHAFVLEFWDVLEPGVDFIDGWPIHALCAHLEAVAYSVCDRDYKGAIVNRLLVNVPPGFLKSMLFSVFFPAWVWGPYNHPEKRFLCASHAMDLSTRDSTKCRRLIQSEKYQKWWGRRVVITRDQNAKQKFENTQLGFRQAVAAVSVTGNRSDFFLIDDAHSVESAASEVMRAATKEWFLEAVPSRINNPEKSAIIIIMQRLHEDDISGVCITNKLGYTHLCLPMEFEKDRCCSTNIVWLNPLNKKRELFKDPRKKEGELLLPKRFTRKVVDNLKHTLGSYATAGQLQQRPDPRGGGYIKRDWFRMWERSSTGEMRLPDFKYIIQSYDTAFTEKTAGDPTGCIVVGVFNHQGRRCVMLLDAWTEHLDYPSLRKKIKEEYKAVYAGYKDVDLVLVENKGSGISILQDIQKMGITAIEYNPGKADKTARLMRVSPLIENGVFYIPESKNRGDFIAWSHAFVSEVIRFPTATHDEMVDVLSQSLAYLHDAGWLKLPDDYEAIEEYREPYKGNPYAQ